VPELDASQRDVVQLGIKAFQREWGRYKELHSSNVSLPDTQHLVRILGRFLATPTTEEVNAFGHWVHEDLPGAKLASPSVAEFARYLVPAAVSALPPVATFWKGGVAALAGRGTAEAVSKSQRQEPVELAMPSLKTALTFAALFVDQEDPATPQVVPVWANSEGLALVTWSTKAEGLVGLRMSFDHCAASLRFDSLKLIARDQRGLIVATSSLGLGDVNWSPGAIVSSPFVVAAEHATGEIRLAAPITGASTLELQLLGAWLGSAA
jgi:hypothetical protein